MNIVVEVKDVYGNETIYPACEQSRLFARIAGTKTLTKPVLRDIVALGYEVQIKQKEWTV